MRNAMNKAKATVIGLATGISAIAGAELATTNTADKIAKQITLETGYNRTETSRENVAERTNNANNEIANQANLTYRKILNTFSQTPTAKATQKGTANFNDFSKYRKVNPIFNSESLNNTGNPLFTFTNGNMSCDGCMSDELIADYNENVPQAAKEDLEQLQIFLIAQDLDEEQVKAYMIDAFTVLAFEYDLEDFRRQEEDGTYSSSATGGNPNEIFLIDYSKGNHPSQMVSFMTYYQDGKSKPTTPLFAKNSTPKTEIASNTTTPKKETAPRRRRLTDVMSDDEADAENALHNSENEYLKVLNDYNSTRDEIIISLKKAQKAGIDIWTEFAKGIKEHNITKADLQ